MPALHDHFRPPLSLHRHWHAFHSAWCTYLASHLNEQLPEGYFAEPNVQFGIEIDVVTGTKIVGNYIGTNPTGDSALGNGAGIFYLTGIGSNGGPATIGGPVAAARNVFSGNDVGIGLNSGSIMGLVIQGNYIGANAKGTAAIANGVGIDARWNNYPERPFSLAARAKRVM